MIPGINLTEYTVEELRTVYTALGSYLIFSNVVTDKEREAIDQFRTKLVEAGALVRETENITSN